ncbi:MAG: lysophospholipid acyltransferase family protein [Ottowia sp.]|uniref:lysophospholipid acyltransferase family protein n=1 Tax=Ottowia sp. TaxID=1898956 RepID=UPI0039E6B5FE
MKALTALWLVLRGIAHLAAGWWTIRTRFPRMTQAEREARVQRWARDFLTLWRIDLEVRGQPPAHGPLLLVANHISWLDILVLHAAGFCRFVAKSDVRRWPVIGMLATGAGTLYIQRESRRDALRVVHHMRDALLRGEVVAVFPEGTTSDGTVLLPFHANLIQAAVSAHAPALPVALQFIDGRTGRPSLAPIYIGDQTLVGSIWRTLTTPGTRAVVSYGQPQPPEGRERRAWAAELRAAVAALRGP